MKKNFYIGFEQLSEAFGAKRTQNLKQVLTRNKVSFLVDINGKPFTTKEALNAALGVGILDVKSDDGFNIDHLQT